MKRTLEECSAALFSCVAQGRREGLKCMFFALKIIIIIKKYLLIFTARISERISEGMGETQALASENNTPATEA